MIVTRKENIIRVEKGEVRLQADRKDPFGFWEISGHKGKQKLDFSGQYTSLSDVKQEMRKLMSELTPVDKKELEALA